MEEAQAAWQQFQECLEATPTAMDTRLRDQDVGQPVELYTGEMVLESGTVDLTARGVIEFLFSPKPTLQVRMSGTGGFLMLPVTGTLQIPELGCSARCIQSASSAAIGRGEWTFTGTFAEPLETDPDAQLHTVRFGVINLGRFDGTLVKRVESETHYRVWWGRVTFALGPWQVTLDDVDSKHDRWPRAVDEKGYTITHVGELRCPDGQGVQEATEALDILSWFLSFVNGDQVKLVLFEGLKDANGASQAVWRHWREPGIVAPATNNDSWLP